MVCTLRAVRFSHTKCPARGKAIRRCISGLDMTDPEKCQTVATSTVRVQRATSNDPSGLLTNGQFPQSAVGLGIVRGQPLSAGTGPRSGPTGRRYPQTQSDGVMSSPGTGWVSASARRARRLQRRAGRRSGDTAKSRRSSIFSGGGDVPPEPAAPTSGDGPAEVEGLKKRSGGHRQQRSRGR